MKVSVATTNALAPGGQFVLGARTLPGNPYDGHTLAAGIAQAERITGVGIERAYVDRGYRGHDAGGARVILSGQKRGVTPTSRRERRTSLWLVRQSVCFHSTPKSSSCRHTALAMGIRRPRLSVMWASK